MVNGTDSIIDRRGISQNVVYFYGVQNKHGLGMERIIFYMFSDMAKKFQTSRKQYRNRGTMKILDIDEEIFLKRIVNFYLVCAFDTPGPTQNSLHR